MQPVEKKKRHASAGWERYLLLALCAAALAAILLMTRETTRDQGTSTATPTSTVVNLFTYPAADVVSLTIHRSGEQPWTLEEDPDSGCFRHVGATAEEDYLLSESTTQALRESAAIITCEQVVSSDPAEYTPHLAEYGLDPADMTAVITFRDGTVHTLRIGCRPAHTNAWYYMTLDGDDRLFALSTGMVESLFVSEESLRTVLQPTLHKVRIDRLTLRSGDGSIRTEWTLNGDIDETDAAERWQLTAPFVYPVDATAMDKLLANAANLRLGSYVAQATPENLTLYGFDEPRLSIEIHMAPGAIGTTDWDGQLIVTDWPESTVTFIIGGARSDMVDYVLCGDAIYVSSHFTMGVFMDIDPAATMSRYPVLVALGNLASLEVEKDGVTTRYALTRTEQVAPNNDLVYDDDGSLVWDVTVTRDGEACSYDAFSAAYSRLSAVSVAGVIPEDDMIPVDPHTLYTFTDVDGTVHTVGLTSYGVLHDAVSVDGHQAFYIAKGAFSLGME
ncbi:MAG: DUF4340 domain-containing protein [Clostridia bacterium]|nr:DUF4340 domain-containing protein [Clostridia bacterium]